MKHISFFRYPGGKSKIQKKIIDLLNAEKSKHSDIVQYREPFFGGGSIGMAFMQTTDIKSIWVNDMDKGVAFLWSSVINFPDMLKKLVIDFKPSVEEFDLMKGRLSHGAINKEYFPGTKEKFVKFGFEKLAIHQTSYSGLGVKSGGPLGGVKQESKYKIDCRWSPEYICKKIDLIHGMFSKFEMHGRECSTLDFDHVISDRFSDKKSLIYLDPPYYVKGNDLYLFGFDRKDHVRLAETLKNTRHAWVLSYDDCPEIRELYNWATIIDCPINYSITSTKEEDGSRKSRSKNELLIVRK